MVVAKLKFLWFALLPTALLAKPVWAGLLCALILAGYGFLLFFRPKLEAYEPHRIFPWLIWVGALTALHSLPTIPPPHIPTEKILVRSIWEAEPNINGIRVGMTQDDVRAVLGEPEKLDLHHFLLSGAFQSSELPILARHLLELESEYPKQVHYSDPLLARNTITQLANPEKRATSRSQNEAGQSRLFFSLETLNRVLQSGGIVDVQMTDSEPDSEALSKLVVEGQGDLRIRKCYLLLRIVEPASALLAVDSSRRVWEYPSKNVALIFEKERVAMARGTKLFLGTRPWAEKGDIPSRLDRPGQAIHPSERNALHSVLAEAQSQATHIKKWNNKDAIKVNVEDGKLDYFQLGL